ncbi:MAG: MFS transporter [Rubrivivax sp.]|nr:MFS transporter [Rubrivivax sp.]
MTAAATPPAPAAAADVDRACRALLAGNFAIGCGVMVTAGALNDLAQSLQVTPAVGGQLITAAAVAMGVGAPLMAAAMGQWDRRRLLTLALLWYAAGHAISALMPSFAALLPARVLTMLAAAVFTPQAAAAISVLAPPAQRGRAITYIFLGWSLASVLGMPAHSYVAETLGWRWAFALVTVLSLAAAWGVWRALPGDVRPPPLTLRNWGTALSNPLFMAMVAVTALSGAGQFTLFSYFAPYYRQELGASAGGVSFLFLWFGIFGLLGNLLLARSIDRWGAASCVNFTLALMALSFATWSLAGSSAAMAVVLVPWALGCFSSNSAQQARLSGSSGAFAPALLALNTSAIYLGQAVGAGSGGLMLTAGGFGALPWAALAWMALAIAVSVWVARRMRTAPA